MNILERIFSADERAYIEKKRFHFSKRFFGAWEELRQETVIVFGGGLYGRSLVKLLLSEGVHPVCIVDNDPHKQGTFCQDIAIKPVSALGEYKNAMVILTSAHARGMYEDCLDYSVRTMLPIDLPDTATPIAPIAPIGLRAADIAEKTALLDFYALLDADSQYILRKFLLFQLTVDVQHLLDIYDPRPYFSTTLMPHIDYTTFCDLGASVGDTLQEYLDATAARAGEFYYYAFEPEEKSFAHLLRVSAGLKNVEPINAAAGERNCLLAIYGTGTGTSLLPMEAEKSGVCNVVSLDGFFKDRRPLPTVIKADVEGYEAAVLDGAQTLIRESRPVLIFSIYHLMHDFYEIPMMIHGMGLGYTFHVRHQSQAYGETIVYALPPGGSSA